MIETAQARSMHLERMNKELATEASPASPTDGAGTPTLHRTRSMSGQPMLSPVRQARGRATASPRAEHAAALRQKLQVAEAVMRKLFHRNVAMERELRALRAQLGSGGQSPGSSRPESQRPGSQRSTSAPQVQTRASAPAPAAVAEAEDAGASVTQVPGQHAGCTARACRGLPAAHAMPAPRRVCCTRHPGECEASGALTVHAAGAGAAAGRARRRACTPGGPSRRSPS